MGRCSRGGKFLLHLDGGQESPICLIVGGDKDSYITVWSKIRA
jgi:hypothetical protein